MAGLEEALKRKDAIIRVRNAQISALWDELHTRQPWTNALSGDAPINLATEAAVNASRKLLVIGINTVSPGYLKSWHQQQCPSCCLLGLWIVGGFGSDRSPCLERLSCAQVMHSSCWKPACP